MRRKVASQSVSKDAAPYKPPDQRSMVLDRRLANALNILSRMRACRSLTHIMSWVLRWTKPQESNSLTEAFDALSKAVLRSLIQAPSAQERCRRHHREPAASAGLHLSSFRRRPAFFLKCAQLSLQPTRLYVAGLELLDPGKTTKLAPWQATCCIAKRLRQLSGRENSDVAILTLLSFATHARPQRVSQLSHGLMVSPPRKVNNWPFVWFPRDEIARSKTQGADDAVMLGVGPSFRLRSSAQDTRTVKIASLTGMKNMADC